MSKDEIDVKKKKLNPEKRVLDSLRWFHLSVVVVVIVALKCFS